MHQFAHMADVHLGANRHGKMAELEIGAFVRAMDMCITRTVDFIVISGDLFHVGVPSDLNTVRQAVAKDARSYRTRHTDLRYLRKP